MIVVLLKNLAVRLPASIGAVTAGSVIVHVPACISTFVAVYVCPNIACSEGVTFPDAKPIVPAKAASSISTLVVIVTVPVPSAALASATAKPLTPGVTFVIGFTVLGPILVTGSSIIATGVMLLNLTCF